VHGRHRVADRQEELSAGFVGTCHHRIEHDGVQCGNRALRRFTLRHVHQGISWNGDQVDFLALGRHLHNHGDVGLILADDDIKTAHYSRGSSGDHGDSVLTARTRVGLRDFAPKMVFVRIMETPGRWRRPKMVLKNALYFQFKNPFQNGPD